nr:basic proline-rich protein-like [Taeniopygia guttata]
MQTPLNSSETKAVTSETLERDPSFLQHRSPAGSGRRSAQTEGRRAPLSPLHRKGFSRARGSPGHGRSPTDTSASGAGPPHPPCLHVPLHNRSPPPPHAPQRLGPAGGRLGGRGRGSFSAARSLPGLLPPRTILAARLSAAAAARTPPRRRLSPTARGGAGAPPASRPLPRRAGAAPRRRPRLRCAPAPQQGEKNARLPPSPTRERRLSLHPSLRASIQVSPRQPDPEAAAATTSSFSGGGGNHRSAGRPPARPREEPAGDGTTGARTLRRSRPAGHSATGQHVPRANRPGPARPSPPPPERGDCTNSSPSPPPRRQPPRRPGWKRRAASRAAVSALEPRSHCHRRRLPLSRAAPDPRSAEPRAVYAVSPGRQPRPAPLPQPGRSGRVPPANGGHGEAPPARPDLAAAAPAPCGLGHGARDTPLRPPGVVVSLSCSFAAGGGTASRGTTSPSMPSEPSRRGGAGPGRAEPN